MIYCYYMNISCDYSYEESQCLEKILPLERLERVNRLRNEERVKKQLLAGAFLQYGLSVAWKMPMKDISYVYGEYGKPELVYNGENLSGQVDFSLSHSGDYAVLAVSDKPVGIDVEYIRGNRITLAERVFCKEEYWDIAQAKGEDCEKRFVEYWTMKEAYVKRTGYGLYTPFNSFRINRDEGGVSFVENEEVYFATFFLRDPNYCVSVCSEYKTEIEKQSRHVMQEITLKQIVNENTETKPT